MAAERPTVDPARVIEDLRELARRTADERGAQRLCWSPTWREARALLIELLGELGLEAEVDEAGNLWARLEGEDPAAPAVALGSHLDSVPDGGWLDGALGVMAALGVLRAWATSGRRPPVPLVLVDWADEEGARFGRSLFGSSAFAGTLDPEAVAGLRDGDGRPIAEVLAENGVELDRAGECARRRDGARRLRRAAHRAGAADGGRGPAGGCGHRLRRRRAAALRVPRPGGARGDDARWRPAATRAWRRPRRRSRSRRSPRPRAGVATTGELRLEPGIPSAIAGRAVLAVDLRHPEPEPLARMLAAARERCARIAAERGCGLDESPVFAIEPIRFDTRLVFLARAACAAVAGEPASLASGALHDAAEVARVLPAAMVFAPSSDGISHAREEDTAAGRPRRWRSRPTPSSPRACSRRELSRSARLFALAFEETHIRPTHSLGFRSPNSPSRRRGSGGPKGIVEPGGESAEARAVARLFPREPVS